MPYQIPKTLIFDFITDVISSKRESARGDKRRWLLQNECVISCINAVNIILYKLHVLHEVGNFTIRPVLSLTTSQYSDPKVEFSKIRKLINVAQHSTEKLQYNKTFLFLLAYCNV